MFNNNDIELNAIKSFVGVNQSLFDKVNKEYSEVRDINDEPFSMLNYEKMFTHMIDFIDGYINYVTNGVEKFHGKELAGAVNFYNMMFTNIEEYRKEVLLTNISDINKTFLELSNNLLKKMDELEKLIDDDEENGTLSFSKKNEIRSFYELANNQYKKISKVYKDDMEIVLWLKGERSRLSSIFKRYPIDSELRIKYSDVRTPVIHLMSDMKKAGVIK